MSSRPLPHRLFVRASVLAALVVACAPSSPEAARYRFRLAGHHETGRQPSTVSVVDGGDALLVASRGDSTVDVFNTKTMQRETTLQSDIVGHGAWGVGLAGGGETIVVANWVGETVTLLDRTSQELVQRIPTGIKPSYLALSPDGEFAYVAGKLTGDLTIIDLEAREVARTLDIGQKPMGVAASPDGRWLYVAACGSNKISKVDLKHEVVLENFGVPLAATTNLAITPDGRMLLAASENERIVIVDTETGDVEKLKVGPQPAAVTVSPGGTTAFVALYKPGGVAVVDLQRREAYETLRAGKGTIHVATDGERLYAANDQTHTVTVYDISAVKPAAVPRPTTDSQPGR